MHDPAWLYKEYLRLKYDNVGLLTRLQQIERIHPELRLGFRVPDYEFPVVPEGDR